MAAIWALKDLTTEEHEQRLPDHKVVYLQHMWDDNKGLKHRSYFYPIFLNSSFFLSFS